MPLPTNILQALGGGVSQPNAPPGSVPGGTQLDMMRKFIEASQSNPEEAKPAYNWAQLGGNAIKSLAAGIMQPQINAAGAINPQSALGGGAPQTAMAPQASAGPAPQQVAALPQGGVDASSFTTQNAQTEDQSSNDNARHNYHDAASRNNNPGAMWPGPIATKWGSTGHQDLADGHGNKIATFDDPVKGAAAQFDLLDKKYTGIPIGRALRTWSTNAQYALQAAKSIGLSPNDPITSELLRSPLGIKLAASMAKMEAGHPAPLTKEQWLKAQTLAFGDGAPAATAEAEPAELPNAMGLGLGDLAKVEKASLTPPGPAQITGQQPAAQPQEQPVSAPQGQGAPVQQVAQRAPGQAPASYSVVPPNAGLSWQDMQHLYQLPKEVREDILKNRAQAFQPQVTETPKGNEYYRGIDNQHEFIGKPLPVPIHAGSAGTTVYGSYDDAQGGFKSPVGSNSNQSGMGDTMRSLADTGQDVKQRELRAEDLNNEWKKQQDMASAAPIALQNLQAQRQMIDNPTFHSGPLGNQVLDIKKLATELGITSDDDSAANEVAQKLRAKENLDFVRQYFGGAGLGRVLTGELSLINDSSGNIENTVGAYRAVNIINTKMLELAQKVSQHAQDYADEHGGYLDNNWIKERNNFINNNRPFTEAEMRDLRSTLKLKSTKDAEPGAIESKGPLGKLHYDLKTKAWVQ